MRNIPLVLIVVSSLMSGCAQLYSHSSDLPSKVDEWIGENRYGYAMQVLDQVSPNHARYAELQKQKTKITGLISKLEKNTVNRAKEYAARGDWAKAFDLIDATLENIPDSSDINTIRDILHQEREAEIAAYQQKLLISSARHIASDISIYEKITEILPDEAQQRFRLKEFHNQRKQVSEQLAQRSEQLYKAGKYQQAQEIIELAKQLNPADDILAYINNVEQLINATLLQQKRSRIDDIKALLGKVQQGHSLDILSEAKTAISWLTSNAPDEKKLLKDLQKHLRHGVEQRFEAGRKLYSEGKIRAALEIWEEVEPLQDSNTKLIAHINRARKVLEKMQQLKDKQ